MLIDLANGNLINLRLKDSDKYEINRSILNETI